MLVISRRKGQSITIGDDIELVVTELHRSTVKLGIRAPRGLTVLRGEIRDTIEEANRAAAASSVEAAVALAEALPEPPPGTPSVGLPLSRRQPRERLPEPARRAAAEPSSEGSQVIATLGSEGPRGDG